MKALLRMIEAKAFSLSSPALYGRIVMPVISNELMVSS
jgi:hypothetical protein